MAATLKLTEGPRLQRAPSSQASSSRAIEAPAVPEQPLSRRGSLGGVNDVQVLPDTQESTIQDPLALLQQMEELQFRNRSPQQPNAELDALIFNVIQSRPEWRAKLAATTSSPWLRKKILSVLPPGTRATGSAALGSTHSWRSTSFARELTLSSTASAGPSQTRVVYNPLITHSENYSFTSAQRFPGTLSNGELDKAGIQNRGTPGPGSYFKSVPRGTAFTADRGETIVFGANHICPWKGALGHQINPVQCDAGVLPAPKMYSFSKSRRNVCETSFGHLCQDGGPVKTDLGCLAPGPCYTSNSTFRASCQLPKPRRSRSSPAIRRMRVIPLEVPQSALEVSAECASIADQEPDILETPRGW